MNLTRRRSLQLMAGAAAAAAMPLAPMAQEESLKSLAARKGMRFGNALGYGHRTPGYLALMARECGVIVAENETKWQSLQPRPGAYQFGKADEMFAWARSHGMLVRGHTLVWQPAKWLPDWVNQHDFGAAPAREAERLLTSHIAAVCDHFGRGIYSWEWSTKRSIRTRA